MLANVVLGEPHHGIPGAAAAARLTVRGSGLIRRDEEGRGLLEKRGAPLFVLGGNACPARGRRHGGRQAVL